MFIMNPKYKVKRGDTLSGIAAKTGFTVAEISAANGIENPDLIYAGAVIDLPLYTVDSKRWKGIQNKLATSGIKEESEKLIKEETEKSASRLKESLRESFVEPIKDFGRGVYEGVTSFPPDLVDSVTKPEKKTSLNIEETLNKAEDVRRSKEVPPLGVSAFGDPNDPTKLHPALLNFLGGFGERREKRQQDRATRREELSKDPKFDMGFGIGALGDPDDPTKIDPKIPELFDRLRKKIPANMRQFFDPYGTTTEEDLSEEQLDAIRNAYSHSQTPERLAEKEAQGLPANLVEYIDYLTQGDDTREGAQYADVGARNQGLGFLQKMMDPNYQAKTLLGQFDVQINPETGRPMISDDFNFPPATTSTGLSKLAQYLGSIPDKGADIYGQLRNFMGYYGPQEGSGRSGLVDVQLARGGSIR